MSTQVSTKPTNRTDKLGLSIKLCFAIAVLTAIFMLTSIGQVSADNWHKKLMSSLD